MIDIHLIRERPEFVKEQLARKGYLFLDEVFLFHDRCMRMEQETWENYRRAHKDWSRQIGRDKSLLEANRETLAFLTEMEADAERCYRRSKAIVDDIMMQIPNLPHESVPDGPIPYHTMVPEPRR